MRHKLRGRQLGRNASHRRAMFRNMACSLITSVDSGASAANLGQKVPGRVITTLEKAKELRPILEKLVTSKLAESHQLFQSLKQILE